MLTGVILAGGKNKRMGGQPKAMLSFSGEQLIQRQIRTMREQCDEVIIVTNEPRPFLQLLGESVRIITDFYPGKGPLSGMHASLSLATNEYVWIVGCDNPYLSSSAAAAMLKRLQQTGKQAAIPYIYSHPWMLHGIYKKSCAEAVSEMLRVNDCVKENLLAWIDWTAYSESEFQSQQIPINFIGDINTPEDYKRVRAD